MNMALIVSHRIRGLVASIEGFTDLLTDTLGTKEQRDLALRIFEGAARIERVLGDLHLYSQPVDPLTVPLPVGTVLDDLFAALDDAVLDRVDLVHAAEALPDVLADPALLRQALLVLVQNALDATRHGGTVRLHVEPTDGGVRFDVWNSGHIEVEDAVVRVFEPFYTTKAQNLGVGLAIARRIAQAHDGRLTLSANSETEGTCFSFFVPAP